MAQKIIDLTEDYGSVEAADADLGKLFFLQTNVAKDAVDPGSDKSTFKGNVPYRDAILDVQVSESDLAVYTAGLPNPMMAGTGLYGQYAQAIRCDGSSYKFTTKFTHAAYTKYNFIALLAGSLLTFDATPADLTEFKVNDDGGKLQIEIGDGDPVPAADLTLAVYQLSSLKKTLMATATTPNKRKPVTPRDVVWIEGDTTTIDRAILEFYCD
jgi:hypothetical protein